MTDQLIPKIGILYKFREDNREYLLKKYKFYYVGLLLCTHEDVTRELTDVSSAVYEILLKNPIYGFEVYNCYQVYDDLDIPVEGIKIHDILFLTLREISDMMEVARSE